MPRLDAERLELWRRLGHGLALTRRELDVELREEHDVALTWFEVMSAIRHAGGWCRVGELGDALGEIPSSLSRRLDRMVDADVVTRSTAAVNGDRRSVTVSLTANGRALWRDVNITFRRVVQRRFAARLTDSDVAALQRIVAKTDPQ